MDHRISKDMISNGMTPSGQKSQQDLSRSQYGSAATPSSLAEAYRKIHEMNKPPKPGVNSGTTAKPSLGNTMRGPSTSNIPKSDEPLATLNRAKKGDGYFGPTVSAGGYRMGIPNPIRKEEVEHVNEAGGPALPGGRQYTHAGWRQENPLSGAGHAGAGGQSGRSTCRCP